MAVKERVRNGAEIEASNELRAATDLGAVLARKNVGKDKDWVRAVPSSHREYSTVRAPYRIFEGDDSPARPGSMLQLVVTDQGDSLPRGPTLFYVLELPPLPVGNVEIKLNTSAGPTLTEVFRPAMDFACMRFWIDVDHELGSDLHTHLSRADQDLMREHAKWAKRAAASVIEARRLALKISQDQFARLIGTSVDTVIGIEVGEIAVNAALLDQIEVAFAMRERTAGFTPHEMSPRLARLLAAAEAQHEEPRSNGATASSATPAHVQAVPQPRAELPMLAEPPESENLDPPDWQGGAKLREQRKRRRLSLVRFAEIARMTPSHVARLERGDLKPTPEVDARIKLTINTVDAGGRQVSS